MEDRHSNNLWMSLPSTGRKRGSPPRRPIVHSAFLLLVCSTVSNASWLRLRSARDRTAPELRGALSGANAAAEARETPGFYPLPNRYYNTRRATQEFGQPWWSAPLLPPHELLSTCCGAEVLFWRCFCNTCLAAADVVGAPQLSSQGPPCCCCDGPLCCPCCNQDMARSCETCRDPCYFDPPVYVCDFCVDSRCACSHCCVGAACCNPAVQKTSLEVVARVLGAPALIGGGIAGRTVACGPCYSAMGLACAIGAGVGAAASCCCYVWNETILAYAHRREAVHRCVDRCGWVLQAEGRPRAADLERTIPTPVQDQMNDEINQPLVDHRRSSFEEKTQERDQDVVHDPPPFTDEFAACKICLQGPEDGCVGAANAVVPCGHLCLCSPCRDQFLDRYPAAVRCPMCQDPTVQGFVRLASADPAVLVCVAPAAQSAAAGAEERPPSRLRKAVFTVCGHRFYARAWDTTTSSSFSHGSGSETGPATRDAGAGDACPVCGASELGGREVPRSLFLFES